MAPFRRNDAMSEEKSTIRCPHCGKQKLLRVTQETEARALPAEKIVELGKLRIFVTHGHHYGVSMGTEMLRDEAKDRGCNVAMYGHTHRPYLDQSDPLLTVLNPGSLAYPRQEGREPSYIVIDIDRFGEPHYTLKFLKRGPKAVKRLW